VAGHDFIFHFAANAESASAPTTAPDLEQNTIATYNVLEAMRRSNIKRIAFSSTGAYTAKPPSSDARGRALPDPDQPLRRQQTGR